jgi:MFS transporter, ACS family, hexuronate transporter
LRPRRKRSAGFRSLAGAPGSAALMLARFFFDPVFYFYMFWIPQYLSRERGLSLAEIGNLTWIPFFALGVTNIAAGRVSDMLVKRGFEPRRARMSSDAGGGAADARVLAGVDGGTAGRPSL